MPSLFLPIVRQTRSEDNRTRVFQVKRIPFKVQLLCLSTSHSSQCSQPQTINTNHTRQHVSAPSHTTHSPQSQLSSMLPAPSKSLQGSAPANSARKRRAHPVAELFATRKKARKNPKKEIEVSKPKKFGACAACRKKKMKVRFALSPPEACDHG